MRLTTHWHEDRSYLGCIRKLATGLAAVAFAGSVHAQSVDWPVYSEYAPYPAYDGFTNTLPDVIGPIDGSARLTILTAGNHFPVFVPHVLDSFPEWCRQTSRCTVSASDILILTLPSGIVVDSLEKGGVRFGNAILPFSLEGPVYPNIVIAGPGPLERLAGRKLVEDAPILFAQHSGLVLLVRRESHIQSLADLGVGKNRIILATPGETGPRSQYEEALSGILGMQGRDAVLAREIDSFPGRLAIQHRDVPYALLNDLADAGIIFDHLARFYAARHPEHLRYVPVSGAARYGRPLAVAKTSVADPLSEAFMDFLLETAPAIYPEAGFAPVDEFSFGERLDLVLED